MNSSSGAMLNKEGHLAVEKDSSNKKYYYNREQTESTVASQNTRPNTPKHASLSTGLFGTNFNTTTNSSNPDL